MDTVIIAQEQQRLREFIYHLRENLSFKEVEEKSKEISRQILNLAVFRKSQNILFYMAKEKEVNLLETLTQALQQHKTVMLPRTDIKTGNIYLAAINSLTADVVPGNYGLLEPRGDLAAFNPLHLDLLLIPGVVFDKRGNRLGRGKGYYDRLLIETTALKIGIAYDLQMVDVIPVKPSDISMDYIITETRIITTNQRDPVNSLIPLKYRR